MMSFRKQSMKSADRSAVARIQLAMGHSGPCGFVLRLNPTAECTCELERKATAALLVAKASLFRAIADEVYPSERSKLAKLAAQAEDEFNQEGAL